jgi:hypothetical protein
MTDKKIPLGISIITILMYITAIIDIAAGIFMVLDKNNLSEASVFTDSVFLYYGIGLVVAGIIVGLLASGLRSASNGVRLVIAIVMGLKLLAGIYALVFLSGIRLEGFVTALVAGVILFYLYGDEDSKAFFS